MKKTLLALALLALLACCLAGCQKTAAPVTTAQTAASVEVKAALAEYMSSVKAQSAALKASLEQDDLTQTDMNLKSKELSDLWDGALNRVLEDAQKLLSEAQAAQLTAEQTAWLAEKSAAADTAGKEYEGGSMHALVVNSESAKRTEARVDNIYELLK